MLTPEQEARVTGKTLDDVLADREAARTRSAWAAEQLAALGAQGATAPYGSPQWCALPVSDPRRSAAIVRAAEAWADWCAEAPARTVREADFQAAFGEHMHEHWVREWEREVEMIEAKAWAPIQERLRRMRNTPTSAEVDAIRAAVRGVEVQASEGWPPVRVPGQPNTWRHLIDGQQVDLPTRDRTEAAA